MEPSRLEAALQKAWCKETSSDPGKWTPENPALGHCAVTALIVHDYFGGSILWAEATIPDGRKISHYFNLIHEQEIDLTLQQFPNGTTIPPAIEKKKEFPTTRAYVLSYEPTRTRYELLRQRVNEFLKEM